MLPACPRRPGPRASVWGWCDGRIAMATRCGPMRFRPWGAACWRSGRAITSGSSAARASAPCTSAVPARRSLARSGCSRIRRNALGWPPPAVRSSPEAGPPTRTGWRPFSGASDVPRVLVVQYSNPAAYPPVEHAALLLAEAGFEVELRGLRRLDEITIARHERIRMQLKPPAPGGWRQKAAFVRFVSWIRHEAAQIRPDWIYASDPLSTPAAWSAGAGRSVRCIYHEHDAPGSDAGSTAMRIVLAARRRVAERATICIAPSDGRAKRLSAETGRADVAVVWNVPLRREVAPPERGPRAGGDTRLLYHGSIVPARVPDTLLRALARLPRTVSCCITGYDPAGGAYQEHLRALAAELKLTDRVEFTGPIGTRQELME